MDGISGIKLNKQAVLVVALLMFFAILLLVVVLNSGSIEGKTKVDVVVAPENARVTANEVSLKNGTNYLEPGEYVVVAEASGYRAANDILNVGEEGMKFSIGLIPLSTDAVKEAEKNEEIYFEIEAIDGERARIEGDKIRNKFPVIEHLPHVTSDFRIDYTIDESEDIQLVVSLGASYAKDLFKLQMSDWGYNIQNYTVTFRNYNLYESN